MLVDRKTDNYAAAAAARYGNQGSCRVDPWVDPFAEHRIA
jgi:hypothetical protein